MTRLPREPGRAVAAVVGALVLLTAAATLVTMPWQYLGGGGLAAARALGAVLALAVGAALVALALGDVDAGAGAAVRVDDRE
jgi:hypothetical protein